MLSGDLLADRLYIGPDLGFEDVQTGEFHLRADMVNEFQFEFLAV